MVLLLRLRPNHDKAKNRLGRVAGSPSFIQLINRLLIHVKRPTVRLYEAVSESGGTASTFELVREFICKMGIQIRKETT